MHRDLFCDDSCFSDLSGSTKTHQYTPKIRSKPDLAAIQIRSGTDLATISQIRSRTDLAAISQIRSGTDLATISQIRSRADLAAKSQIRSYGFSMM